MRAVRLRLPAGLDSLEHVNLPDPGERACKGRHAVTDLPKTSKPAERALASLGVRDLESLARFTEQQVAGLHGMGPKGVRILKAALAEEGLAFKA